MIYEILIPIKLGPGCHPPIYTLKIPRGLLFSSSSLGMQASPLKSDSTSKGLSNKIPKMYHPSNEQPEHLKMDGWNTILSYWEGLFFWCELLVLGRISHLKLLEPHFVYAENYRAVSNPQTKNPRKNRALRALVPFTPPNINMAHQNRPLKKEMLHAELGVHVSFRGCVQVCFLC